MNILLKNCKNVQKLPVFRSWTQKTSYIRLRSSSTSILSSRSLVKKYCLMWDAEHLWSVLPLVKRLKRPSPLRGRLYDPIKNSRHFKALTTLSRLRVLAGWDDQWSVKAPGLFSIGVLVQDVFLPGSLNPGGTSIERIDWSLMLVTVNY